MEPKPIIWSAGLLVSLTHTESDSHRVRVSLHGAEEKDPARNYSSESNRRVNIIKRSCPRRKQLIQPLVYFCLSFYVTPLPIRFSTRAIRGSLTELGGLEDSVCGSCVIKY